MGGKGSGGARVGAGRKRKGQAEGALTGSRRVRARIKQQRGNQTTGNQTEASGAVVQGSGSVANAVAIPEPPGSLTLDELGEWNELAPLAAKAGTLTDETRMALRDLCQARVLKDRLLRAVADQGDLVPGAGIGTVAAHPLITKFTTLLQRVEAGMMRFRLAPMGKSLETGDEKPADPFAEFDAAPSVPLAKNGETVN